MSDTWEDDAPDSWDNDDEGAVGAVETPQEEAKPRRASVEKAAAKAGPTGLVAQFERLQELGLEVDELVSLKLVESDVLELKKMTFQEEVDSYVENRKAMELEEDEDWFDENEVLKSADLIQESLMEVVVNVDSDAPLQTKLDALSDCVWFPHIDFIADYGTNETALLDGDALLAHVVAGGVDMAFGGQFLHAIYAVEQLIQNLRIRSANFEIFFLGSNAHLNARLGQAWSLLRRALILHLQQMESVVHIVPGHCRDAPWLQLMRSVRPSYVISDYGWQAVTDEHIKSQTVSFVHDVHTHGLPVVLLQGLEVSGSRLKAFVANPPLRVRTKQLADEVARESFPPSDAKAFEAEALAEWPTLSTAHTDLRTYLHAVALTRLAPSAPADLTALACVYTVLLSHLPLSARALALPDATLPLLAACKSYYAGLQAQLATLLHGAPAAVAAAATSAERALGANVADLCDGRLFHALYVVWMASRKGGDLAQDMQACFGLAGTPAAAAFTALWTSLSVTQAAPAVDAGAVAAFQTVLNDCAASCVPPPDVGKPLLQLNNEALTRILGDVGQNCAPFESEFRAPAAILPGADVPMPDDDTDAFMHKPGVERVYKTNKWSNPARQAQLRAKAEKKLQDTVLTGSNLKQQVIGHIHDHSEVQDAQRIEARDLARRRLAPVEAAAEAPSTDRRGGGKKEKEGVKKGAWKQKKEGGSSKAEAIRNQNKSSKISDAVSSLAKDLEGLKKDQRLADLPLLEEKMTAFASKCMEKGAFAVAVQAELVILEKIVKDLSGLAAQKKAFLCAQRIMRNTPADKLAECQLEPLVKHLANLGFRDFASAIGALVNVPVKPSAKALPPRPSVRFQLEYLGPHLARPKGSDIDPRVQFRPDVWQSTLLDVVDAEHSALIIAPTSSGKTFVSYYCMEKILRTDNESIVVYVSPTKALVNQVMIEVAARFSKQYSVASMVVAGVFTRDFRESPTHCQILVTVPACLEILLTSPQYAEWCRKIKYCIFDEVHCIGSEGGEVWEQCLLQNNSPFLALSATIGNAENFHGWLDRLETRRGRKLHLITHNERYNDLSPMVWGAAGVEIIHPAWCIPPASTDPQRPFHVPEAVKFLPEHCLALYDNFLRVGAVSDEEKAALDPENAFQHVEGKYWNVGMRDVCRYEAALKQHAEAVAQRTPELFAQIMSSLTVPTQKAFDEMDAQLGQSTQQEYLRKTLPDTLRSLEAQGSLPCIVFHLNRVGCEWLAINIAMQMVTLERAARQKEKYPEKLRELTARVKANAAWLKKLMDKWKHRIPTNASEDILAKINTCKNEIGELGRLREADPRFVFKTALKQVPTSDELKECLASRRHGSEYSPSTNPLHQALARGIGVHHAGLPKKYRQAVESLFRQGKLAVVIATATLSMGVNMPCKTVVFGGDCFYLNSLLYRQMSGRAGRRGYDLRGNVLFVGLSQTRVRRLLTAELPVLQGNLVFNASFVLRSLVKLHDLEQKSAKEQAAAVVGAPTQHYNKDMDDFVAAVQRVVTAPLFEQGTLMAAQHLHVLRFVFDYLRTEQFVDATGVPNDISAFAAHFYWTEPANFALTTLLRSGLLAGLDDKQLVLVLSNLFFKLPLHPQRATFKARHATQSAIALDPLGDRQRSHLVAHNQAALARLVQYFRAFLRAYTPQLPAPDALPLSGLRSSADPAAAAAAVGGGLKALSIAHEVCSSFVALSGRGDEFASVAQLCASLRPGLFLDAKLLPLHDVPSAAACTNAYLYDFYVHGTLKAVLRDNGIVEDVAFENLKCFALLLKALVAALEPRSLADAQLKDTLTAASLKFNQQFQDLNKV